MAKLDEPLTKSPQPGSCFPVYSGRLVRWKAKGFHPVRLAIDPGQRIKDFALTPGFVHALTYNLQYPTCSETISSALRDNWLKTLNMNNLQSWEALIALLHTGIEFDIIKYFFLHLPVDVPSEFMRAFHRELVETSIVPDLIDDLVRLGFPEILESVSQLETGEEVIYYMKMLPAGSVKEILDKYGVCDLKKLVFLCKYESQVSHRVIPLDPPAFRTPESFWNWYCDFMDYHNLEWAAKWKLLDPNSKAVHSFYTLSQFAAEGRPSNTASTRNECNVENTEKPRRLILWPDANPQFFLQFQGKFTEVDVLVEELKIRAACIDQAFGKSLQAASVGLRNSPIADSSSLAAKLVPLEVLSNTIEKEKYMTQIAAEILFLDPITALSLGVPRLSEVLFPTFYLSDPIHLLALMLIIFESLGEAEHISLQSFPRTLGILGRDISKAVDWVALN